MMRRFPSSRQGLFLVLLPLFILSACSLGGGSAGLAKPPTTKGALNATPTASIRLGVQTCPDAVKASDRWTNLINLASTQKIESVICAYLMGVPTLQAVLKIRASGNERPLDLAVFTNLTSAKPEQIFSLKGLAYGDVSISNYNTLLTMQIDLGAKQNQVQHDIYREFKWSDSAKTLGQVNFVGLYPDMTRYQAEYEQDQINNGKGTQQWRLSAITTSQNFAEFDLGWPHASSAKVISGGGTHDANAVVQVKNPSAGNTTIKLSLSRLEFNTDGGIWEVTEVTTDGLKITTPQSEQQLTSPVQVRGTNSAFAENDATITVLDQDHTEISQTQSITGETNFSTSIVYASDIKGKEAQEGILVLNVYNGNHVLIGVTMVKVLLSA